jgi:hypothetical protein
MAVSPGLGITVAAGVSYYRITSLGFRTASARHHPKVVKARERFAAGTGRGTITLVRGVYTSPRIR